MRNHAASWLALVPALSLMTVPALAGEVKFEFDPSNFSPGAIDNQYWPLMAGMEFVYYAESGDGCAVNQVKVTGSPKSDFPAPYDTITAWVVEDREWLSEECDDSYLLTESTKDWYAQDNDKNIWYFGEETTSWDDEDECPSNAGEWQAGTDGAIAGVVVPGNPKVGSWYQQELYEGEAEDRARVLRVNARVSTELGTFAGCLKTKEYTPLDPGHVEHKFYCPVPGGLMLINELKGKTVRVELIGDSLPPGEFPLVGDCD